MSLADRFAGAWAAALARRSLDARVRFVTRTAIAAVALLLGAALAGQVVTSARLSALQRTAYPALRDTRALAGTLAAFRAELASGGSDAASVERADSLAARFHRIARASQAPGMAAADARFAEYMLEVRRLQGQDSPAAAAAALESYRVLESQLASDADAAEREVASGLASGAGLQWALTAALAVTGAVALLLLVALSLAAGASLATWVDGVATTLDALVRGDFGAAIRDSGDDAAGRLAATLRRLSRQLRDNSEVAQALAAGAFRRAVRNAPPQDPTAVALAQLTRSMEEIASAAQRIARGDLRSVVTPQSPEDTFGQAHAAMMRRITTTLRDVEASRQRIAGTVEEMRADAAALAAASAADADRLRRATDKVSQVTLQASAIAARGEALTGRAEESEALLEEGTSALSASVEGIRQVLQRSEDVQRLARNAGMLAVCAMADAGQRERSEQCVAQLEGEARQLATEAAAVAGTMTRIMIDGTQTAFNSGVAVDQVALAVRESTAMVRELGATARRQATELAGVDERVVQVQGAMLRTADGARQLSTRLDSLATHVRELDTVLRRLNRGQAPVYMASSPGGQGARGPALYHTPAHASEVFPRLAIMSR